jgi:hypothetical protein
MGGGESADGDGVHNLADGESGRNGMKNLITVECYDGFWQVGYVFGNGTRFGCLRYEQDELGSMAMTICVEGLQREGGCGVRMQVAMEPARSQVQHEIGFGTEVGS